MWNEPEITPRKSAVTRIWEATALAYSLGLSRPLGRAIYAVNRQQNAYVAVDVTAIMVNAKDDTAKQWCDHYLTGGSVKSLSRKRKRDVVADTNRVKWGKGLIVVGLPGSDSKYR